MSFSIDVISLFPDLFPGPLKASVTGRGLERGLWQLNAHQLRDFGAGTHKNVDDTPAGGGPGMVLRADIMAAAIDAISPPDDARPRILLSPRGAPLTQKKVHELADGPGMILICGRFEGVDQRVIDQRNLMEISIGDYVLAGGELAAMVLSEAVVRLLPGVLGAKESRDEESHENGLLEYPHYTRPALFEGQSIPPVLTSGNHGAVKKWRQEQSEQLTRSRRPDLWNKKNR